MMHFISLMSFKHFFQRAKKVQYESLNSKTVKVLVMGKSGVGKTSVIRKLCNFEQISATYVPTCYDVHQKELIVDEYNVTMQFMDLGGSNIFPSMQDVFIRQADIFLLIYSADDTDSFNQIQDLRKLIVSIKHKHSTELPIIVVRNKCDKRHSHTKKERIRKKSVHQWCFLSHDVSAKSGVRINAVMDSLIEESKFIGNPEDLGNAQFSGRYVYNDRIDGIEKKEQFHKSPSLFHRYDNSDEKMEKRRRKSFSNDHQRSLSRRRSSLLRSFKKLKRSNSLKSNLTVHSESHNTHSSKESLSKNSVSNTSRKSSDCSGHHPSVPTLPIIIKLESFNETVKGLPEFPNGSNTCRRKSLSSIDVSSLQSFQKKNKLSIPIDNTDQLSKAVFRGRSQSDLPKRPKPSKLDIVHTTLPKEDLPDNYQVPIYSRSGSKKENIGMKSSSAKAVAIVEEEEDPSKIYPVPAWRSRSGSYRHSLFIPSISATDELSGSEESLNVPQQNLGRRKSVSHGDLSSIAVFAKKRSVESNFNSQNTISEESITTKTPKRKVSNVFGWAEKRNAFRTAKKASLQADTIASLGCDHSKENDGFDINKSDINKCRSWSSLHSKNGSFDNDINNLVKITHKLSKQNAENDTLTPSINSKIYKKSISH